MVNSTIAGWALFLSTLSLKPAIGASQAAPEANFGDAPQTYGTLLANDGARHLPVGPTLGKTRTAQSDALHPLDGRSSSDDDGVVHSWLAAGRPATFTINVSAACFLNLWIDFDNNGKFSQDEHVSNNRPLYAGDNTLQVNIPEQCSDGAHFARFRVTTSSVAKPKPTGLLPDGEVEDYALPFRLVQTYGAVR